MSADAGLKVAASDRLIGPSWLLRQRSRQLTSWWYVLAMVVFMPLVYVGNRYFHHLWYGGATSVQYFTDTSGAGRQDNGSRLALEPRRQRACPLAYFRQRRDVIDDVAGGRPGQHVISSQSHLPADIIHRSNSTISLIDLDIPSVFNSSFLNPCWYETVDGATRRLRCLPYYFLAGFPKCGTTDLYFKMTYHPQIRRANRKEPHWWTRRRLADLLNTTSSTLSESVRQYVKVFDGAARCLEQLAGLQLPGRVRYITGDGSASTVWDNRFWSLTPGNERLAEPRFIVADLIRHYLPASKIIVIVRDPVYRLFSDYLYFWSSGRLSPSAEDFHAKVKDAIESVTGCLADHSVRTCVYSDLVKAKVRIKVGMYSVYLRDWFRVFPRNQIHVLRTENYATSPEVELKTIFDFLGLDSLEESIYEVIRKLPRINQQTSTDGQLSMWAETERLLRQFYSPYNKELSEMLNNTEYLWLDSSL